MNFVKVQESKGLARVQLARPDARNAFSTQMIEEVTKSFLDFHGRKDLQVIVLSGEGSVFCAGADLVSMKESIQYSREKNKEEAAKIFRMFSAIADCPQTVLASVRGAAFGGGLGLLAASDIVVAEEKTKLCFSEVKLGIAPAMISGFVLKKSQLGSVLPWMVSGRVFSPQQAVSMGLVHEVVEEDGLEDRVDEWARDLTRVGPVAMAKTKELLNTFSGEIDPRYVQASVDLIAELRVSNEGQEGIKSFLEKRDPSWRGS